MTLTAGVITALSAHPYRPEHFVEILFPGYAFRACTLTRAYTLDGDVYAGGGGLLGIGPLSDVAGLDAQGFELTITGLDASLMTELRDYNHQGAVITVTEAVFDANLAVIPDPFVVGAGIVNTMSFHVDEDAVLTIAVRVDGIMKMIFRGPDGGRRMQAQQIAIYPGDVGLEYGNALKDDISWGVHTKVWRLSNSPPSTSGAIGIR